jgi:hypothetical protein
MRWPTHFLFVAKLRAAHYVEGFSSDYDCCTQNISHSQVTANLFLLEEPSAWTRSDEWLSACWWIDNVSIQWLDMLI